MAGRRGPARNEVDIRERVFDRTRHTAHGGGVRSFMGGGSGVDLRVQTLLGEAVAASWCIDGFGRNGMGLAGGGEGALRRGFGCARIAPATRIALRLGFVCCVDIIPAFVLLPGCCGIAAL